MTVVNRRLESARVDPRLLRSPDDGLVGHILDAANDALADHRAREGEAGIPVFDLDEISQSVRAAHEQYVTSVRHISTQLHEGIAELRKDGLTVADPPALDFTDVVDDLTDVLETIGDMDTTDLQGVGESDQGLVRAVCVPGDWVDSLTVEPAALRGTVQLDRSVVRAVNAALDDLAAEIGEWRATQVDPAVRQRLNELRERNLAHFASYTRALSGVLGSINAN